MMEVTKVKRWEVQYEGAPDLCGSTTYRANFDTKKEALRACQVLVEKATPFKVTKVVTTRTPVEVV